MPDYYSYISKTDNILPEIEITEPADKVNITEGSNIRIVTNAEDKDGTVVKVEFFVDGNSIGYNTIAPFDWVWFNANSGKHLINAVAFDNDGGKSSSSPIEINIVKK